jgi:integrase
LKSPLRPRRGSLLKLRWQDVDLRHRVALLCHTKGGSNVEVPLTLKAVEISRTLPRESGEAWVFPLRSGTVS